MAEIEDINREEVLHTISEPLLNDRKRKKTDDVKDFKKQKNFATSKMFDSKAFNRVKSTQFKHIKLLEFRGQRAFSDLMHAHNALYQHWRIADSI